VQKVRPTVNLPEMVVSAEHVLWRQKTGWTKCITAKLVRPRNYQRQFARIRVSKAVGREYVKLIVVNEKVSRLDFDLLIKQYD